MSEDKPQRRCDDCSEHSGMIAQFEAGKACMNRLEKEFKELRKDFADHLKASSKSTIFMLFGILMCFLTGVVSIYVSSGGPKDKYSSQAEMTLMVKAIASAIKEAKK